MSLKQPRAVALPQESRVASSIAHADLADAYAIDLPHDAARCPEALARFVFAHQPRWVYVLMHIRDTLVAGLGLKTGRSLRAVKGESSRIGIFKVYEANCVEIIMGEDDRHLDCKVSALYQPAVHSDNTRPRLVLSTVVQCHNRLGRGYLGLIAPFHRLVIRSYLRQAARIGWPIEDGAAASIQR